MSARRNSLIRSISGAVAPTVALSLFALIAAGGIAFDYARMASMGSELQSAADHAALAAASQLDGKNGACIRAANAARNLIINDSRFANDGGLTRITIADEPDCDATGFIKFYETKDKLTAATNEATANFVEVTVNPRTAFFALTPIVSVLSSGPISKKAYAGVDSALCAVVPFFVCNPDEPEDNDDPSYPVTVAPSTGIQMLEGGDQKGPGNFGFLVYAGRGARNLAEALSSDAVLDDCTSVSQNVETETGQKTAVFDALNRRFDMNTSCSQPPCSPSTNEVKDLVRQTGSCNWKENDATEAQLSGNNPRRYRPTSNTPLAPSVTPTVMGHPRDICHAAAPLGGGGCARGQIGNGVWDRGAYFRSNHPGVDWATDPELGPNVTRYQTYLWEAQEPGTRLQAKASEEAGWSTYGTPQAGVCNPPGVVPNTGGVDRRRVTAAVVNCRAYGRITGRRALPVAAYMDVFLVEPTLQRRKCNDNTQTCRTEITGNQDIYVEVIGASGSGQGGGTPQITRRDTPRLIE